MGRNVRLLFVPSRWSLAVAVDLQDKFFMIALNFSVLKHFQKGTTEHISRTPVVGPNTFVKK